jgi:hypothetical protein
LLAFSTTASQPTCAIISFAMMNARFPASMAALSAASSFLYNPDRPSMLVLPLLWLTFPVFPITTIA